MEQLNLRPTDELLYEGFTLVSSAHMLRKLNPDIEMSDIEGRDTLHLTMNSLELCNTVLPDLYEGAASGKHDGRVAYFLGDSGSCLWMEIDPSETEARRLKITIMSPEKTAVSQEPFIVSAIVDEERRFAGSSFQEVPPIGDGRTAKHWFLRVLRDLSSLFKEGPEAVMNAGIEQVDFFDPESMTHMNHRIYHAPREEWENGPE